VTASPTDPDARRRRALWARVFLRVAFPAVLLGGFFVLALWPGLNLEWVVGEAHPVGVHRTTEGEHAKFSVRLGVGNIIWLRQSPDSVWASIGEWPEPPGLAPAYLSKTWGWESVDSSHFVGVEWRTR
jgi:hypothetical protein